MTNGPGNAGIAVVMGVLIIAACLAIGGAIVVDLMGVMIK